MAIRTRAVRSRKTGANARQYGGEHYKQFVIEPWDFIAYNDIPYLEGCVVRYVTRWRSKGGLVDLEKAKHYIDKIMEVEKEKEKEKTRREIKS